MAPQRLAIALLRVASERPPTLIEAVRFDRLRQDSEVTEFALTALKDPYFQS